MTRRPFASRALLRRPLVSGALVGGVLLGGTLLLSGCTAAGLTPGTTSAATSDTASAAAAADLTPAAVLAENADTTVFGPDEWDEAEAIDVDLAALASTGVTAGDGTVTITAAGVYRLSGTLSGQVVVSAPEEARVVLILDGATITNSSGSAIDVQQADDVAIHLADGSTNRVADAQTYPEDAEANAAIYSTVDLTFSGTGALTVSGNGNDGITSKDDLVILDGSITVTAQADALRGKDALVVEGGDLSLTAASGDGMTSTGDKDADEVDWTRGYIVISGGTIDITAGDDGIQAFTDTVIGGGTVTVSAADDGVKGEAIVAIGELADAAAPHVTVSSSTEGIEAAAISLSGGVISVTASDDGVNASGNTELQALMAGTAAPDARQGEFQDTGETLTISGGELTVDAEGDGLDSNGSLTITGGTVVVSGPKRGGNGSLDADGEITVTGGTVTALGPGDMEQTPSAGTQGWVIVSAAITAGQSGTIVDSDGAEIAAFTARKDASSIIYSAGSVTEGESYSVQVDGETIGSAVAGEGGSNGPGGGMGTQGGPGGTPPGDGARLGGSAPPGDGTRPGAPAGAPEGSTP